MRRLVVAAAVAAGCGSYDPLDDVEYREYPDTRSAVAALLEEVGPSPAAGGPIRVYAVGEYHATAPVRTTPLARFTSDILPVLAPRATHMVIEAWFDPSCSRGDDTAQSQVEAVTRRPAQQPGDLRGLLATSGMPTHGLAMTCIEHSAVLDADGKVDFVMLLAMISDKLLSTTRALVDEGATVIVYGGALHNDLYPRWLLESLSYGHVLAREVGVVELDLVVPEVVFGVKGLWREPWFPLLARSSPDRVVLWQRGPGSYVVILPAENDAIARRMTDVM